MGVGECYKLEFELIIGSLLGGGGVGVGVYFECIKFKCGGE